MQNLKPQLANDADLDRVIFPCMVQPKLDGVRAWNPYGKLLGRSMDPFAGHGITDYFSRPKFLGKDGEMILGDNPYSTDRLCHLTAGAMGKFKGIDRMANLHWYVFDYLTQKTITLPYVTRYEILCDRLNRRTPLDGRIHLMPSEFVHNRAQLDRVILAHLDLGAEGAIIRNPNALPKPGRPTKSGQQLWRFKVWMDAEILVTDLIEGEENRNEAKLNTLGKSERSSAKAGKVPNGQIGSLKGLLLQDIIHPISKVLLLRKGIIVTVGSGEMSVAEATAWFRRPSLILGHIVTFKFMPHGMKDAPRMPTFKSKRLPQDFELSSRSRK